MTTELQKVDGGAVAVASPGDLLGALVRAASDPSTNIDVIERLYTMHQKEGERQAERAFNAALARVQGKIGTIAADSPNTQTNSKYAKLEVINKIIKPIIEAECFSLSFNTDESPKPDHFRTIGILSHADGHTRTYRIDMPYDNVGIKGTANKTLVHATGSTSSYARRYLTCLIFNISTGDDKDGNSDNVQSMPEGQKADFLAAIEQADKDGLQPLWEKITKATATDAEARDDLRKAMLARKKVLA
tara:strand:+ start:110 stop:847 length:738 start_codon:yes stop_codon:yes gene_type:complete